MLNQARPHAVTKAWLRLRRRPSAPSAASRTTGRTPHRGPATAVGRWQRVSSALTVGSLFAGIGGFDLGLERAGMRTVWQVERDPYCRDVLASRFPEARRYDDVSTVDTRELADAQVVCGGFPCQDLSPVGRRAGIAGKQSGLWTHFARVIRDVRPRYVIVENVPGLLVRGLDTVLADLADVGYDAEWDCFPAAPFGAPHLRARIFLLAYPRGGRHGSPAEAICAGRGVPEPCSWWQDEPGLARLADGLSGGLELARRARCHALGNALVPQIAEWIGHRILDYEGGLT